MKFYTDTISKELLDALVNKRYPYRTIPTDYKTLYDEDGVIIGGFPEYGITFPTYAEVLDWLLDKGFEINIFKKDSNDFMGIADVMSGAEQDVIIRIGKDVQSASFKEAIEKTILICLDFIEISEDDSSYSVSTIN